MEYKQKTFIMIIAVIGIVFALIWQFAIPLEDDIERLGGEITKYQEQIAGFTRYTNYMTDLRLSYKKNEDNIDRISEIIVKESEYDKLNFIKEIERISDTASTRLEIIPIETKAKKSAGGDADKKNDQVLYSSFDLNLRVAGTFSGLLDFLVNLENMEYYTNVESVSVSRLADGNFPNASASGNIKLKVYTSP